MLGRSHNLRSARLRGKRRKALVGRIVMAGVFLVGVWASVFGLSGFSAVTIRNNIDIEGNAPVPLVDIASTTQKLLSGRYFFTVPRSNIFFYPRASIEKAILAAFPQIERVEARLKNFHTLGIRVVLRRAVALWCTEVKNECFTLDARGLIFGGASTTDSTFLKFYITLPYQKPVGQTALPQERFNALLRFAKELGALPFRVTAFRERQDGDMEAELLGGQRIIFGRDSDLSSILANFETILSDQGLADQSLGGPSGLSRVDYIDLRFGNKVFYKLK